MMNKFKRFTPSTEKFFEDNAEIIVGRMCESPYGDYVKYEQVTDLIEEHQLDKGVLEQELKASDRNLRLAHRKFEQLKQHCQELAKHLTQAHKFVEHTEAFGSSCNCGTIQAGEDKDTLWNIDESKELLERLFHNNWR
jgi:hypothetical protein